MADAGETPTHQGSKVVPVDDSPSTATRAAEAHDAMPSNDQPRAIPPAAATPPVKPRTPNSATVKPVKESKPLIDPTGKCCSSICQLFMFAIINLVVVIAVFFWPNWTEYKYWHGGPSVPGTFAATKGPYNIKWSFSKSKGRNMINLGIDDKWDGPAGTYNSNQVYANTVNIGSDRDGDPGWNLQDILDIPRNRFVGGVGSELIDPTTLLRLVEDLRVTQYTECNSVLPPYATAVWVGPLGSGRCGLVREEFVNAVDGDWDAMFGNFPHANPRRYGRFGFPNASLATGNPIISTGPTGSAFLCNLGRKRLPISDITIETRGCHVEIQATQGDGYSLWVRQKGVKTIQTAVTTPISKNLTTGCRSQSITVALYNPQCPRPQVDGIDASCATDCVAVLYKGENARRIPIIVAPDPDPLAPTGSLLVNDRHLVLDHGQGKAPWDAGPQPDLQITTGNIQVELANARIRNVAASSLDGEIRLNHLRYETANLKSTTDDIVNEDNRDFELRYRSAAKFLCLASPLVEDVPGDLPSTRCDMAPPASPNKHVHLFYDTIADGYIDRAEFLDGMTRLGLDFQDDSLKLNTEQQTRLYNHVFSMTNIHAAATALTYDLFQDQLDNLAPYFTTLYDSTEKAACLTACTDSLDVCREKCQWACTQGGLLGQNDPSYSGMTVSEPTWGLCDPSGATGNGAQCSATCGTPDISIDGYSTTAGQIDYNFYDVDPPDGIITYEEMRQALLKIYSNCTYVIEPNEASFATCRYVGGGQFDALELGEVRRECRNYDNGEYDRNKADWRYNNEGLADFSVPHPVNGVVPKECRPFPDYNPALNGKTYDPACILPECFNPDGTRVPEQYYNRATWTSTNHAYVLSLLRTIFRTDVIGNSFQYFNISDDSQYRLFGSKMFAEFVIRDRVPYDVFNSNLETLSRVDGVGENFYLFNPGCYLTKFQKIRPWWSEPGPGYQIVNEDLLEDAALDYADDQPTVVENTNMPGYIKNDNPLDGTTCMDGRPCNPGRINPCPVEYGDGTPGSAKFPDGSDYRWYPSNNSLAGRPWGSKWGKRLPPYCMDETWPLGGDPANPGFYPRTSAYAPFEGEPIPPGCEPTGCKPMMKANVIEGSIHSQVLPFEFDWTNTTGHYQTMAANCSLADGSIACFFKGFDATADNRLRRADASKFETIKDTYAPKNSPFDSMVVFDVTGNGVPNKRKYFWSSRPVYTRMEPAWVNIMSGGILGPDMLYVKAKKTPGYCNINFGAVEHVDWTDNQTYGQSDDATIPGLRTQRDFDTYQMMYDNMIPNGALKLQGAFILKNVWRTPFENETMYLDEATSSASEDTAAEYIDPDTGDEIPGGQFFEHRAACLSAEDNCEERMTWLDNCLVERDCLRDSSGDCQNFAPGTADGSYLLSPCEYANGQPAWTNNDLNEMAPPRNFTYYKEQFPLHLGQYHWEQIRVEEGPETLKRHERLATSCTVCKPAFTVGEFQHNGLHNISNAFYDKREIYLSQGGDYVSADAEYSWVSDLPLLLTIVFSMIIASMCGIVGAALGIWLAVRKLDASNERLHEKAKMEQLRREKKRAKLVSAIELERKKQSTDFIREHNGDVNTELTQEMYKASDEERAVIYEYAKKYGWVDNGGKQVGDWDIQFMRNKYLYAIMTGEAMPDPDAELLDIDLMAGVDLIRESVEWVSNELRTTHNGKWWAKPIERSIDQIERTIIMVFKLFQMRYPSPFEVTNMIVVSQLRTRLINSLKTFINVRCIKNRPMQETDDIRLGGAADNIGEFSDDVNSTVIRLGVNFPVGIAKTIYGRVMRYKVNYVTVKCFPFSCVMKTRKGDDLTVNTLVAEVTEGPLIGVGKTYHTTRQPWEDALDAKHPSENGRTYSLPVPTHTNGTGGCAINFVIQAASGTRTMTINTMGLVPHLQFKTILRNFSPMYEKFCLETDLIPKKVLASEASLRSQGIVISKRLQELVKGLRPMTDADRAKVREERHQKQEQVAAAKKKDASKIKPAKLTVEIPVTCRIVGGAVEDLRVTPDVSLAPVGMEGGAALTVASGGGGGDADVASPRGGGGAVDDTPDPLDPINTQSGYASGSVAVLGQLKQANPAGGLQRTATISATGTDGEEVELPADGDSDSDEEEAGGGFNFLEKCDWPIAQFIRNQYVVSRQYTSDQLEFNVFQSAYHKWCKRQKIDGPDIDPAQLELFDLRYDKKPFYDMFGVAVNEVSQSKSVASANKPMFYLLRCVEVVVHCLLLWVVPYPLIFTVFWHQKIYVGTTAVAPQFTTTIFRESPTSFVDMYIPVENETVLWICFCWLFFGYLKLLIFYTLYKKDGAVWRIALKSMFYMYLVIIFSMTLSLVFLILTWCILGAIIKPDSFLPYAVASLTLVGHAKATYAKCMEIFKKIKDKVAIAVAAVFAVKVAAALSTARMQSGASADADLDKPEPFPLYRMHAGPDNKVDFGEFCALLDRFDIDMIDDKRRMLFARVDRDGSGAISYDEFEEAWSIIQDNITENTMEENGVTRSRLIMIFVYAVVVLCLVFAFIFTGVAAFVGTGTLGALVNSALTAFSGISMHTGQDSEDTEDENIAIEV